MRILVLDTKNRVVDNISRYQGTVNSSVLRAAEIYRPAVIRNCPAVLICHNHPSGDPTPSPEDVSLLTQA
jgi:DNA repair protein RadC